jgi:hypothetical protein
MLCLSQVTLCSLLCRASPTRYCDAEDRLRNPLSLQNLTVTWLRMGPVETFYAARIQKEMSPSRSVDRWDNFSRDGMGVPLSSRISRPA